MGTDSSLMDKVQSIQQPATSGNKKKCENPNPPPDEPKVTVSTGEYCTIKTAISYGIFDNLKYFNSASSNDIDPLIRNEYDFNKKYSLCDLNADQKVAIQNCALSTGNPWKTVDSNNNKCMLPLNVELPDGLKYRDSNSSVIEKPPYIPKLKSKTNYYQERWYDWFSIPDYHLGNKHSLSSNGTMFLRPCQIGFVPHLEIPDKCVSKSDFNNGYFEGTFNYLPLSLVHLLGHTKDTLIMKHIQILQETSNSLQDAIVDNKFFEHIMKDAQTQSNIFNDIRTDIKYHINALMSQPFDDRNIFPPTIAESDLINNPISPDKKDWKTRIIDGYNIASNFMVLSTSQEKDMQAKYIMWKKNLAEVNGYEVSDSKFYRQLLALKKACRVSFNYKSPYSKALITAINADKNANEAVTPLDFAITPDDRILSVSANISENVEDLQSLDAGTSARRTELLQFETELQSQIQEEDIELKTIEYDPLKYNDLVHREAVPSPVEKNLMNMKNIVMTGIFLIMLVIFFGIIYIIASILWQPLASMLNIIILSIYEAMFKIKDSLFNDGSKTATKNMLQLQYDFVSKKLINDLKKYGR